MIACQIHHHQLNLHLMIVDLLNGLAITIAMMRTTMKNVAGMVETVVDLMLIQCFVLLVNALIQMQQYQLLRDHQDLVLCL